MSDKRIFPRTRFDSRVSLLHPEHGAATFRTGDVSDGGVYVKNGEYELAIGDEVLLQIQDLPGEAPIVRMRVVRRDAAGYGLRFADREA